MGHRLRTLLRLLTTQHVEPSLSVKSARSVAVQELRWLARSSSTCADFEQLAQRRIDGEPLAYILGNQPFYPLPEPVLVRRPVLIPRPETEAWVNDLINHLSSRSNLQVLDIGTGTGCIALALKHSLVHAECTALDINPQAVNLARQNAERMRLPLRVFEADLFAQTFSKASPNRFDLVVSNPPYIPDREMATLPESVSKWEDARALRAEDDGLAFYKRIAQTVPTISNPDALCVVEVGHDQASRVERIFNDTGNFNSVHSRPDPWGIRRTVWATVSSCVAKPGPKKDRMK